MRHIRLASLAAAVFLTFALVPTLAMADTYEDLYGTQVDRSDFYEEDPYAPEVFAAPSVEPMEMSGEMLYFCTWESGQNYGQTLSAGDGYHAMGYFQFDCRYGLGDFLQAAYNYNPSKYAALKVIGDRYGWDTDRATRSGNSFTQFGNDLNAAWTAAYNADRTEFAQLQNGWAYQEYYSTARSYLLSSRGIDLDKRADSVRSLCWGMCNLFGSGGWQWFANNADITNAMTDEQIVSSLTNCVIKNVSSRYPTQSQYWNGWRNRYRNENAHYLKTLGYDVASLAARSKGQLATGQYFVACKDSTGMLVGVANGSSAEGANVQLVTASGDPAQGLVVSVGADGYATLASASSGKVLTVSNPGPYEGDNVVMSANAKSKAQRWVPVRQSDGTFKFYSALGQGLVLDVNGGSTKPGTNVQVWGSNDSPAQTFVLTEATPVPAGGRAIYRVYNPNSGLHHYTTESGERDILVSKGWRYEGISFFAGSDASGEAVYRAYNPNDGTHNWTTSTVEQEHLASVGWDDEGLAWRIAPKATKDVYRLYNPNSGEHFYTTSAIERDSLVDSGWDFEGVAWRTL